MPIVTSSMTSPYEVLNYGLDVLLTDKITAEPEMVADALSSAQLIVSDTIYCIP